MAKPSSLPQWGTDTNLASGTETGTPVKVEPTLGYKQQGFVPSLTFVAPYVNWLLNLIYQWVQYLDNLHGETEFLNKTYPWTGTHTFSPTAASTDGVDATGAPSGNSRGGRFTGFGTGTGVLGRGGMSAGVCVNGSAQAGSNSPGVHGTGDGTGRGGYFKGGDTAAEAVKIEAGTGNTDGLVVIANGSGDGLDAIGGATDGSSGVRGNSAATNGNGGTFNGTGTGSGVNCTGAAGGHAVRAVNNSGTAVRASGDSGDVTTDSNAAVYVISASGGTKIGVRSKTTSGTALQGESSTGDAGVFTASSTGVAVKASNAASGNSMLVNSTGSPPSLDADAALLVHSASGSPKKAIRTTSAGEADGVSIDREEGRGLVIAAGSGTVRKAHIRLIASSAPSAGSIQDGDLWFDGIHLYIRIAGVSTQLD